MLHNPLQRSPVDVNDKMAGDVFVALSRTKQRAIFAFCRERGRRRRVAELFQLLTDAGVPEIAI
jgi:hypothetical protein